MTYSSDPQRSQATDGFSIGTLEDAVINGIDNHPTLLIAKVEDGRVLWANQHWKKLLPFSVDSESGIGSLPVSTLFANPKNFQLFLQSVQNNDKEGAARVEHALVSKDGATVRMEVVIQADMPEAGIQGDGLWVARDISFEYGVRHELRELEKQTKVLNTYPWGLCFILNKNFYLTYVSPSSEPMLGYQQVEMLGEHLERYLHPEDMPGLKDHFLQVLNGDMDAQIRITTARTHCHDGQYRKLSYRFLNYLDVSRVRGVVVNACDLNEVGANEDAAIGVQQDALTGLPGRVAVKNELEQLFARSHERRARVALLWIDLDHFYEINETHGYGLADTFLAQVAAMLTESVKSHVDLSFSEPFENRHLIARMNGDVFLIAMSDSNQTHAESLAQAILGRLRTENMVPGIEQHVGASIGIAIDSMDGEEPGMLLLNAETASIQAKKLGGSQYYLFTSRLARRRRTLRELDVEVRGGIERREFSLFYQPQLSLRTGRVLGVEALLRWQHPERGLLLPGVFMEALHQNRLVDVMTRWALTRACEQSIAWQKAGLPVVPISVNINELQFQNPHLPAIIANVLMKTGMPARNLILEVTEANLIENNIDTQRVTEELKQLGVRLGIGDFGVGYSSLNYLRRQVVSQIKLGKDFVQGLPGDAESSAIISAIITIGRSLKYQVIAECVETQPQVDHLRSLGCDIGQGFHLSAPLTADEFQTFAFGRPG